MHTPVRVLITGCAGFIGSNFVRHLLNVGGVLHIVGLDLLTYAGSLDNLVDLSNPTRFVFQKGSICDAALVSRLLREHQIDTIVHFAAESHVDRSIEGPSAFVNTNVTGTFALVQEARRYWLDERALGSQSVRFHHVSTDEVFGSLTPDAPHSREGDPYLPNSPYAASKAASDHFVRAYHRTFSLPTTMTHCSNNYGPFQHPEKFIPTIIRSALAKKSIPIYGDGSNVRDWLHVHDHCVAIERVITRAESGKTYNIGGKNGWSNNDVATLICKFLDELLPSEAPHDRLLTFVTDRLGHDARYAVCADKIASDLGWQPTFAFEEALRDVVSWYVARMLPATNA